MSAMSYRRVILLLFFLVLVNRSFSQSYNFRTFTSEDGLAQSFVYSIIQDNSGYLWIGTDNGVSRYNGFEFENFTTQDSLADNFITCSITDRGGLWFGHRNGRLSYYNGRNFRSFDIPVAVVSPVTHFVKGSDGRIWVSTYSGSLLRLGSDTGSMKHFVFKDQIPIITFNFTANGELLVATDSGLLLCRLTDDGEVEIIRKLTEIPELKVTAIEKMRNNQGFFIATEDDGIYQLIDKDKLLTISKINTDTNFEFVKIQHIIQDSNYDLWVCSFGKGLIKINDPSSGDLAKITEFNNSNGFSTVNVKTIYEDREGNIWSGNYGDGLTLIVPKTFSLITFDKALYGNSIFSICLNRQYRWLGTEKGLLKTDQMSGQVIKFYGKENGLPKDTVSAIYSADGKEFWIGTNKNGVFRLQSEKETILKYPLGNGVLENSISMITGKGDQIWIGTKKGLCNIHSGTNRIKWYSINQGGLPHNIITSLFLDNEERLWVCTKSGVLAYIQNEKVIKIPLNLGSGILTLSAVTEDMDSRIWVGSNGNGVFLIESDTATNLTAKEGLLSNYCYSLLSDNNQNIWVVHKGGLSRIRSTDYAIKPMQCVEYISSDCQYNPNAIIKDQNEKIWFGSDKGLISYDPTREVPNLEPPVLGITSIKINDEEKEPAEKIILSPGNYKIRIDFLGINLKEPELVTYQYKMEGYDQWSDITKNTNVTYDHLTEGKYTFILKASSGDGAVSENPLAISFIIEKPIWKKWWFYTINVLLLYLSMYFYIKSREKRFLDEKKILEEKVIERTFEIQSQKNEIELQRDEIDRKNASITSSIRYARHIQYAVLPPIELIDKLLPDNFILRKPKDIVSGDFYWLTEKNNKIIFTVADCTGHGVPGAFMSLLGITLLNEIVNIHGITRSDDIVTNLRDRVIQSLQQRRNEITTRDGMDLALCVLDKQNKKLQFTGAMNDLVHINNNEFEIIKADRLDVSASYEDDLGYFTMKEINYQEGDVLYLSSDGYQDQFGGENNSKYLRSRFYDKLFEIYELPMMKQKRILEEELQSWMKDNIQTDDITVMGIRL